MEEKKSIKVSLGTVVCLFIIMLLSFIVKHYYYGAYMLSYDFFESEELSKKWSIQDILMKKRPVDENFYRGFEMIKIQIVE